MEIIKLIKLIDKLVIIKSIGRKLTQLYGERRSIWLETKCISQKSETEPLIGNL